MEIILKDIVCNSTKADKCLNKINYTFKENSINFCSGLSGRLLRDLLTLKKQRESGFIFVNPKTGWISAVKNNTENQKRLIRQENIQNLKVRIIP